MAPRGPLVAALLTILLTIDATQGFREVRSVDAENGFGEDVSTTKAPNSIDTYGNLPEFGDIIKDYDTTKLEKNHENWREGLKFTEALNYMLNASKLTDCAFVVGQEGHTEKIEAHAVILATASPVFEAAFENSTSFRVADWQPSEFKKLLRYIYSGALCFDDFEEACTILKLASTLELAGANDAAREYISNYMFPNRLWQAFQCAKEADNQELIESVMKLISSHTSEAMKDQKFSDLSREEVTLLLQRDDLAVNSEVDIFDAVTRWGLKQAKKTNQTATPELIRQMLGPSIIKNIRFLTMTGAEFSRIHINSRILSYEEGLAVLLYINSPGGLDMPSTLSSNTRKRQAQIEGPGTFFSVAWELGKCKSSMEDSVSDLYTITEIPNTDQWTLQGIQIPKSLEARADCSLKEHFDVLILDSADNVVYTYKYNKVPDCTYSRYKFDNADSPSRSTDNNLISVQLSPHYVVPRAISQLDRYKIKIVFHEKREYPKWIDAGAATMRSTSSLYSLYGSTYFTHSQQNYGHFRVLHGRPFVYSLFT